jgi:hypothetical protein
MLFFNFRQAITSLGIPMTPFISAFAFLFYLIAKPKKKNKETLVRRSNELEKTSERPFQNETKL